MKKSSGRNKFGIKAWLISAALTALANQANAQSADSLIETLVDKGILTVGEAQELRDQADNDFKTTFQSKTGMPDWVTGYKVSGDFRGRFDQVTSENNLNNDRARLRYRLRFGVAVNMLDNMEAGFRLGSADAKGVGSQSAAGNPLSSNSTMQDNFTKKNIYIDMAYGKWTIVGAGDWQLAVTVGKMENPFNFTPMVFDPDLTPEGGAITGGYTINDHHAIVFTGAAFAMDEESSTTHDPFMYGGQILWNAKWTPKLASTLGVGAFQIVSAQQLTAGGNVPGINQGNTRQYLTSLTDTNHVTKSIYTQTSYPVNHFTPLIADASVTYTLDSFPFYAGTFPVKFAGEYINNTSTTKNNNGFWVGVTLGKSGTKRTWDIAYRYEYLEADAWYDQIVDDDNGAYYGTTIYPGNPRGTANASMSKGWMAGTNIKGHLIKLNYSFTDSFTFSAACYLNDLINLPQQVPAVSSKTKPVDLTSGAMHFMADLMWKF